MAVQPPLIPRADALVLDPDTGNMAKPWYLALANLFRQASIGDGSAVTINGVPVAY